MIYYIIFLGAKSNLLIIPSLTALDTSIILPAFRKEFGRDNLKL
jgi:hypothetical protein